MDEEEEEEQGSILLEEEIDEHYRPTNQGIKIYNLEIREYANFLGMELPEDNDLLYIAREGLMAPLPESWYTFIVFQETLLK